MHPGSLQGDIEWYRSMAAASGDKVAALRDEVRTRVAVQQGDMRTFSLGETFALVIIPFRALLHNLTAADQVASLKRAHEHLRPGAGRRRVGCRSAEAMSPRP